MGIEVLQHAEELDTALRRVDVQTRARSVERRQGAQLAPGQLVKLAWQRRKEEDE